jgi:tRNA/rRNA methyltransferase
MIETTLARCRLVLVRPHYAGNLGSAARVMKNFGLSELVLVEPIANPQTMEAVMMATRGLEILTSARRANTLAEAVGDCNYVLATSGEVGGLTRKGLWGTPEEKMPSLLCALDTGLGAIVFGPEPSGLTVEEIAACHGMIYIPADDEYPSLNLAQAIAICLYELRKQWLNRAGVAQREDPPASYADQERLFEHLKEALYSVRFLWDFRSDGIFHVIRQVITRGMPSHKELQVWHGLAKQLLFMTKQWGVPHPRDVPQTRLTQQKPPSDDARKES